jgi:flagellar hook-basal body complex protein FliE
MKHDSSTKPATSNSDLETKNDDALATNIGGDAQAKHDNQNQGIGFTQTLKSVLMGFIGIQSSKDHQRDFEKGKPSDFIITGVVMTILFILTVYWVVSSALEDAGL